MKSEREVVIERAVQFTNELAAFLATEFEALGRDKTEGTHSRDVWDMRERTYSLYCDLRSALEANLSASVPGEAVAWRFVTRDGDKYEWQDISDKPSYVREVGGEVIYEVPPPNMTIEYAYTHPAVSASVVTEAKLKEWAWELERDQKRGHLCDVQRRAAGVAQSIRAALERAP